jgi:hypothetical protein
MVQNIIQSSRQHSLLNTTEQRKQGTILRSLATPHIERLPQQGPHTSLVYFNNVEQLHSYAACNQSQYQCPYPAFFLLYPPLLVHLALRHSLIFPIFSWPLLLDSVQAQVIQDL